MHAEKVKAEHQLFGEMRKKRRPEKRWQLLELIKLAEVTLGFGGVRLDHYAVREALDDAIKANDWGFLLALSRWHEEYRKPLKPDALSEFIWKNWERLQHLTDDGITKEARAMGLPKFHSHSVRDRRLKLGLKRTTSPQRAKA